MRIIKKFLLMVALVITCFGSMVTLNACGVGNQKKVNVVCTIFPIYDWTREIVGDSQDVGLTLLLGNGTDMHSYEPSFEDMAKIATADLFIYVGGESDEWVDKVLANVANKNLTTINLMEVLGDKAKEEEIKEGMESEEEEEEETTYDEHVWLSVKNAQVFAQEIADTLGLIDSSNKDSFARNAEKYIAKLSSLDSWYEKEIASKKQSLGQGRNLTLLFADRFPFRYFVEDYGIDYYAAFVGCSAKTEASFSTITSLANKVDELELDTIYKIETSDGSLANTIRESTTSKNQKIVTLDSMQNTTLNSGKTYWSVMVDNLSVLTQAFK